MRYTMKYRKSFTKIQKPQKLKKYEHKNVHFFNQNSLKEYHTSKMSNIFYTKLALKSINYQKTAQNFA